MKHSRSSLFSFGKLGVVLLLIGSLPLVAFLGYKQNNDSGQNLQPFSLTESIHQRLDERFNLNRTSMYLLSRNITIKRPIDEVFTAVMTPQLWTTCYPETIAVGSVTSRSMRKGDLVFEKFMFNGMFYAVFRYDVQVLNRPNHAMFHGILMHSNALVERVFGKLVRGLGGSFDYHFRALDAHTTEWTRNLYLYSVEDDWLSKAFFWLVMAFLRGSQEKGATLFVECTKYLLELPREEHERELFGE